MRTCLVSGCIAILSAASGLAQDAGNGLQVKADPNCVVANGLVGAWRPDPALAKQLGSSSKLASLEFRSDPAVLAKIPVSLARKCKDLPILIAGTMRQDTAEHVFLLTVIAGNPTVVWFRERGGDPCGDAESWNVMFVRAAARPADLLFVGGDSDNQAFAAYVRDGKPAGKLGPEAALTEIAALVQAGRVREFVETYCAPEDMDRLKQAGKSIDALVERFRGEHAEPFVRAIAQAAKQAPEMSADGDLATWRLEEPGLPKTLRLQRIAGRWYLRDR